MEDLDETVVPSTADEVECSEMQDLTNIKSLEKVIPEDPFQVEDSEMEDRTGQPPIEASQEDSE